MPYSDFISNVKRSYAPFQNQKMPVELSSEEIRALLYSLRASCGLNIDNYTKNLLSQKLIYSLRESDKIIPATKEEISSAYNLIDSILDSGRNRVTLYYNSFKPQLFEYIVDTLASFGIYVEGVKLEYDFPSINENIFNKKSKLGFFKH